MDPILLIFEFLHSESWLSWKGPFPLHWQFECDPLFKIHMRAFANRMQMFTLPFWSAGNVWFLANIHMQTIVLGWRQPIRRQLYETKGQRWHWLSKGDRFHWLNKQLNFVWIRLKCVSILHAFEMRKSQITSALWITIEVYKGLEDFCVKCDVCSMFHTSRWLWQLWIHWIPNI